MSEIYKMEKFPEDANIISSFFFHNKSGTSIYLLRLLISEELCNQSGIVFEIKNSNAGVWWLLCMNRCFPGLKYINFDGSDYEVSVS